MALMLHGPFYTGDKQRILSKEKNLGKENSLQRKDAKKAKKNIANKSPILNSFLRKIANIMKWKKVPTFFEKNVTLIYNWNWKKNTQNKGVWSTMVSVDYWKLKFMIKSLKFEH